MLQAAHAKPKKAGAVTKALRSAVFRKFNDFSHGRLTVTDCIGSETFGSQSELSPLEIDITVNDFSVYVDVAVGGSIGAAEAYIAGKFEVSDLTALVRLFVHNRQVLEGLDSHPRIVKILRRLVQWQRRNTRSQSRRNIEAHYDLGDDLFRLFLDRKMMYSSAVFPNQDSSLDEAATYKLDLICRKLDLNEGDHVLEIGTGWGGFALHAAENYGCRVTTTTISKNQFDTARQRVEEAGLADRITVLDSDYRNLNGTFDKLVSIEMIEAVGLKYLDTFFRACSHHLKPTGRMLIQAIVIADKLFERPRKRVDFIQKHIFPGGALPSLSSLLDPIEHRTDMHLSGSQDIGLHYARTCREWRERFLNRLGDIRDLGYPEEFIRMWEYYLCYCEGGFLERSISAVQLTFDKPDCRAPVQTTATLQ